MLYCRNSPITVNGDIDTGHLIEWKLKNFSIYPSNYLNKGYLSSVCNEKINVLVINLSTGKSEIIVFKKDVNKSNCGRFLL